MANHLTPTELARESGMERRDVIAKCMELGVPIFQGRIDKTLFLASLRESASLAPRVPCELPALPTLWGRHRSLPRRASGPGCPELRSGSL